MRWFQREQGHQPAPQQPRGEDDVEVLSRKLDALDRRINASAGRLPLAAVPQCRRITDMLRTALGAPGTGGNVTWANDADRSLDVRARQLIAGMAGDYLPTTLSSFLALDPATASTAGRSGRSPAEGLLDQLAVLEASTWDLLTAVHNEDVDSLTTQGSFLTTKFSRSDLDL
ncbi:MAG: hypothetical protein M3137_13575 [Actinomycetota bacterium]|nr:hypothetical protein [Actinomycetota bacterium]